MHDLAEKLWVRIQKNLEQEGVPLNSGRSSLKHGILSAVEDVLTESNADLHLRVAELEDVIWRQQNQTDLLRGQIQRRDAEAAEMRRSHYRQVMHLQEQLYRQQTEDSYVGQIKNASLSSFSHPTNTSTSFSSRPPSSSADYSHQGNGNGAHHQPDGVRPESAPPSGERLHQLSHSDIIAVSKHTKLMQQQRRKMLEEMKRMEIDFEKKLKGMEKSWELEYERQKQHYEKKLNEIKADNQELEDRITHAHRIIDDLNDQLETNSSSKYSAEENWSGYKDPSRRENRSEGIEFLEGKETQSRSDLKRTPSSPQKGKETKNRKKHGEDVQENEEEVEVEEENETKWNTTSNDPQVLRQQMIQMERELQNKSTVIRSLKMRLQRQSRSRYAEYTFDQPSMDDTSSTLHQGKGMYRQEKGEKILERERETNKDNEKYKEGHDNQDTEETPLKSRLLVLNTNEGNKGRTKR